MQLDSINMQLGGNVTDMKESYSKSYDDLVHVSHRYELSRLVTIPSEQKNITRLRSKR